MKKLLPLIFLILISVPAWAYLTAGKVSVVATSSSSGVPSTSKDSDISDNGSAVTMAVPVAVTGNVNITGTYQVNGTPISATSNWNQVGSTINYTAGNVGIGLISPGQSLDVVGTVRSSYLIGSNGVSFPYVKVSETETSGTSGGTATSGSWITRVLNTKDSDTGSIASITSNQVTLPAGTYLFKASAPFIVSSFAQIRLYNVTTSTALIIGQNCFISTNSGPSATGGTAFASGSFTLSATSALAIQYQVTTTQASDGLGSAAGFGTEVYTIAEFQKTL